MSTPPLGECLCRSERYSSSFLIISCWAAFSGAFGVTATAWATPDGLVGVILVVLLVLVLLGKL
jgi:hypothetical protein